MRKLIFIALLPITAMGATFGPDNVNTNTNAPVAAQDQLQGQAQGQLQGQAQGQLQGQGQGQTQGNLNVVGVGVDVENRVDNRVNSTSLSGAESRSASGAIAGSIAGAEQGQSQTIAEGAIQNSTETSTSQTQAATATNAGNAQSITFNAPDRVVTSQKGTENIRTVPTAIAPNVYPTASCAMSASMGASTLGTGVSFGGTKVNEECMQLEGARMFSQLGYPVQGLLMACSTKSAVAVFGTAQKCIDAAAPATPVQPIAATEPARAEPVRVETRKPVLGGEELAGKGD